MKQVEQEVARAWMGFRSVSSTVTCPIRSRSKMPTPEKEISHLKQDGMQHFRTAAESTQPLKQWAHELKQECEPLMESARALNAMAESIRSTVMVVDDDEFQRKIIGSFCKLKTISSFLPPTGSMP